MLEEVLKGVSIVLYEALCCKIFFDIFLKRKYASLQADIISVALLTGLFLLCAVSTQFGGYYIYRMMAVVASILLFSFIFIINTKMFCFYTYLFSFVIFSVSG